MATVLMAVGTSVSQTHHRSPVALGPVDAKDKVCPPSTDMETVTTDWFNEEVKRLPNLNESPSSQVSVEEYVAPGAFWGVFHSLASSIVLRNSPSRVTDPYSEMA